MKRSDAPAKQPVPFGVNGTRESLLATAQPSSARASYDAGFPPITMTAKASGGLPPKGPDFNQILYELSDLGRWGSSGALQKFDATFSTAISGYPEGALLMSDDSSVIYLSTVDDNTANPNSDLTGWVNLGSFLGADTTLRSDLASSDAGEGSDLVAYNAITVGIKLGDFKSATEYGYIGDGTYHPLSEKFSSLSLAQVVFPFVTSLTQSIDWAAMRYGVETGRPIRFHGKAVITDNITIPSGSGIIGEGVDRWVPGFASFVSDSRGSHIIGYGTGSKSFTVSDISDCSTAGGKITNPSASDAYTSRAPSPYYSLYDFTNQDASGVTPATSKPFSALISTTNQGNVILKDFRVVNNYNGQEGYKSESNNGLGDAWDVGIYLYNSQSSFISNVQSVGYWRIASCLKVGINDSSTTFVEAESDHFDRCTFQGFNGLMVRSMDLWRVTSVTADTIEIPWSSSHQFASSGSVRVLAVDRTYTGLTFSGDKLTFTGVSSTTSIVVGSELRKSGNNFGMSGTLLSDCYITSLYHHSRLLCTSVDLATPFSYASCALQISGEPVRAINFSSNTIIGRDDVLIHMHRCADINMINTYWEGQAARDTLNGTLNVIPAGVRIIASSVSNSLATYPAGSTTNLRITSGTYGPGVDKSPRYSSNGTARFVTGTGLYKPREDFDDKEYFPEASSEFQITSLYRNARMYLPASGSFLLSPVSGDVTFGSTVTSLNLVSPTRVRTGNTALAFWDIFDSSKHAPLTDNSRTSGLSTTRWSASYAFKFMFTATVGYFYGSGSPEGVLTAGVGSEYSRTDGGASTTKYVKESGTGNTGWVAK